MKLKSRKAKNILYFLVSLVLCLSIFSPLYYSPLILEASASPVNSPDGIWVKDWTFSRIRVDSDSPTNIYNEQDEVVWLHGGAHAQLSYSVSLSSAVIRNFADIGVTFIRIPIGRTGGDGDRWYNPTAIAGLDNGVQTANEEEVYIMIDMHSFPDTYGITDLIDNNEVAVGNARQVFYADWVYMGKRLDGNISVAVLEATNEPWFTLGERDPEVVMQNWTIVLNELKWHLDQNCTTDYILASPACPNYKSAGGSTGDSDWWATNPVNYTNRMINYHAYWKDMASWYDEADNQEFKEILNDAFGPTVDEGRTGWDWYQAWVPNMTEAGWAVCNSEYGLKLADHEPKDIISNMMHHWMSYWNISWTIWKIEGGSLGNYAVCSNQSDPLNTLSTWGLEWFYYLPPPTERLLHYKYRIFQYYHTVDPTDLDDFLTESYIVYNNGSDYTFNAGSNGWINFTTTYAYTKTLTVKWWGVTANETWSLNNWVDYYLEVDTSFYTDEKVDGSDHSILSIDIDPVASVIETNLSVTVSGEPVDNGTTIFEDDFSSGNLDNWNILSGDWQILSEAMKAKDLEGMDRIVTDNVTGLAYIYNITSTSSGANAWKGIIFHYNNASYYYYLRSFSGTASLYQSPDLYRVYNGTTELLLDTSGFGGMCPAYVSIKTWMSGSDFRVKVWVNDTLAIDWTESPANITTWGMESYNFTVGAIENSYKWSIYDDVIVRGTEESGGVNFNVHFDGFNDSVKILFANETAVWAFYYYNGEGSVNFYGGSFTMFFSGDLPPDFHPPNFSELSISTLLAGNLSRFLARFTDNSGLSHYIFGTNNTGNWINQTSPLSGTDDWGDKTITLNETIGQIIGYRWYVNDTVNLWNSTTILIFVTTVDYDTAMPLYYGEYYIIANQIFSSVFFGQGAIFGYFVLLGLTMYLLKKWKIAGVLSFPVWLYMFSEYHRRIPFNPFLVYYMMMSLLVLAFIPILVFVDNIK